MPNRTDSDLADTTPEAPNPSPPAAKAKEASFAHTWWIVLTALTLWKASTTNLEYALTYYSAYFVASFVIYAILSLFTKRTKKRSIRDWLNGSAYTMLAIIALSLLVRYNADKLIQDHSIQQASPQRSNSQVPPTPLAAKPLQPYGFPSQPVQPRVPQQDPAATQDSALAIDPLTKDVQLLLKQLDFDPGQIDGKFGARTKRALDRAQRSLYLPPNSTISLEVREQLRDALNTRPQIEHHPYLPQTGAARGGTATSGVVSRAQVELRKLGYYLGDITGVLDGSTRGAIIRLQADRHVIPSSGYDDGDLDYNTLRSLRLQ